MWGSGDTWVAYKAPSLIDPENLPYPGFAVRTRSRGGDGEPCQVVAEVWSQDATCPASPRGGNAEVTQLVGEIRARLDAPGAGR